MTGGRLSSNSCLLSNCYVATGGLFLNAYDALNFTTDLGFQKTCRHPVSLTTNSNTYYGSGTFVTINEPVSIQYCSSKPILYPGFRVSHVMFCLLKDPVQDTLVKLLFALMSSYTFLVFDDLTVRQGTGQIFCKDALSQVYLRLWVNWARVMLWDEQPLRVKCCLNTYSPLSFPDS